MTGNLIPWQVFAVRYAHHARKAADNFLFPQLREVPQLREGSDPHDANLPLDFFVWAIVGPERTIVVDLGFDHAGAARRGRTISRLPSEGLATLGIAPESVEDVVITHLHYDHCGDLSAFPKARIYLQDREMAFATGRHMGAPTMRMAFDVEYVTELVRAVYAERVVFVDGAQEIAPGVSVHHVGGHTDGLQVVRVWTEAGWLVLASDAVHLYANMSERNPFPIVHHVGDMHTAWQTLQSLASHQDLIVPGHDPLVLTRFPPAREELRGEVARLDLGPVGFVPAS